MNIRAFNEPRSSLYDQLGFTETEIKNRLEKNGLGKKTLEALKQAKEIVEANAHHIVGEFYNNLLRNEKNSLLIGDSETLARLKGAQRDYLLDMFDGIIDQEYVNNRLRVGLVHKRIGVSPDLYLSAVLSHKTCILDILRNHLKDDQFAKVAAALERVIFFDMGLVFDAYINCMLSELNSARIQAENYAKRIEKLSINDPLTGLMNRRALDHQLKRLVAHARRSQEPLTAILIDLDKFKTINDQFGHAKGDEVLRKLAGLILETTRQDLDIACRIGGDEFVVFLANCMQTDALHFIERIEKGFNALFPEFSFSAGIASTGPSEFLSEDELILQADTNMYRIKHGDSSFSPKVAVV